MALLGGQRGLEISGELCVQLLRVAYFWEYFSYFSYFPFFPPSSIPGFIPPPMAKSGSSEWTLGLAVKVTTDHGETLEGQVFSYDGSTGMLVLSDRIPGDLAIPDHLRPDRHNFRFVNTSHVTSVQPLGGVTSNGHHDQGGEIARIGPVNVEKMRRLEAQKLKQESEAIARIGFGVSDEAQTIFNALAKT